MLGQDCKPQPKVGDAFAFKIGPKLYAFAWVARTARTEYVIDKRKRWRSIPYLVIACASWVGAQLPTADELAARKVLQIVESGKKRPLVRYSLDGPRRGFIRVGRIAKPTAPKVPEWYGDFGDLRDTCERQWMWDHARGKLLADDRAAERAEAAEDAAEARVLKAKLAKRKAAALGGLGKVDLLPEWEYVPARHKKSVDKILRVLIAALRRAKDRAAKLAAIEACVLAVNAWNDRTGVIETEEREALIDAIDAIAHKAGIRGRDLPGPHRDW